MSWEPEGDIDAIIAHLPEVIAAVAEEAVKGGQRATTRKESTSYKLDKNGKVANKGPHSFIEVTHGSVDSFVSLVDPGGAAAAIELGSRGRPGKHYITGAFA